MAQAQSGLMGTSSLSPQPLSGPKPQTASVRVGPTLFVCLCDTPPRHSTLVSRLRDVSVSHPLDVPETREQSVSTRVSPACSPPRAARLRLWALPNIQFTAVLLQYNGAVYDAHARSKVQGPIRFKRPAQPATPKSRNNRACDIYYQ